MRTYSSKPICLHWFSERSQDMRTRMSSYTIFSKLHIFCNFLLLIERIRSTVSSSPSPEGQLYACPHDLAWLISHSFPCTRHTNSHSFASFLFGGSLLAFIACALICRKRQTFCFVPEKIVPLPFKITHFAIISLCHGGFAKFLSRLFNKAIVLTMFFFSCR